MKGFILTILIIVLVVLFGTWPLSIIGRVFEYLGKALETLAKMLNLFGWNGIV